MDETDRNRIYSGASPDDVAKDLKPLVDFKDEGMPLDELARLIEERLVPHFMRYDSPCFQSLFNAFAEPGAKLGAQVALEWNQGVTNWQVSPGGAVLEKLCMEALCRLFGLAPGSGATCMYCGTYANQQAVYTALHKRAEERGFNLAEKGLPGFDDPARLTVVASRDAHFSVNHTVRMLGLGERNLVAVNVDENRRIDTRHLRHTLEALRKTKEVFCVVATAGTTSTGSVDPIRDIADLCCEHGIWLHVDGAYGLAYSLVPRWRHLFAGLELADSVSWDPHKQLAAPIPSSILFCKREGDFGRMAYHAGYFNRQDSVEPNPGTRSAPTTRPLSALALVASILHQGLSGMIRRLEAPLGAISKLAAYLEAEPDMELAHQPDTGILCFQVAPAGYPREKLNDLQKRVYDAVVKGGQRSISISKIGEKTVLRLVAISPLVTFDALKDTIGAIREVSKKL